MEETPAGNISINLGRAAKFEIEGAPAPELRFLLFAEQAIVEELTGYSQDTLSATWRTNKMGAPAAKRYAATLNRVTSRICELIEDGV